MPRISPSQRTQEAAKLRAELTAIFDSFEPFERLIEAREATTRVKLIDRTLTCLGWNLSNIDHEVPTASGLFVDYEMHRTDGPALVVEAKRADRTFALGDLGRKGPESRTRSINTLLSRGGPELKSAMNQAAGYCNDRAIPLAAVTNGYQWIFFQGLSTRGRLWSQAHGIVFTDPEDIYRRLDDFLLCLDARYAGSSHVYELLQRSAGEVPETCLPTDFVAVKRRSLAPETVAGLRAVGEQLLGDIHGGTRTEMLEYCYVPPGTQGQFERTVQNLLKDTEEVIREQEQSAEGVEAHVFDGQPNDFVSQVTAHETLSEIRDPVLVVGHVGAGKTTFLHKAMSSFRNNNTAFSAVIDFEGKGRSRQVDAEAVERWTANQLLEKLGQAARSQLRRRSRESEGRSGRIAEGELQHADPFSPETLRTVLKRRIDRARKMGSAVYENDSDAWARKELSIFEELTEDPQAHLWGFVRQLNSHFRQSDKTSRYSVLIILDNLDQTSDEYQRCVYGFAQRLAKETPAVVVLCLRESTFIDGKSDSGFLSGSPLTFVFHVQAPPLDRLLRQRVKFGRHHLERKSLPPKLRRMESLVDAACSTIEKSLLVPKAEAMDVVAALAGHNMRHGLGVARALLEGSHNLGRTPEPSTAYLMDSFLASSGELRRSFRICNLFGIEPSPIPTHSLPARLLAHYSYAREAGNNRARLERTDTVLAQFASWGYPLGSIRSVLRRLFEENALQTRASAPRPGELPARLSLSASGHVHLSRLLNLPTYRAAMALTTCWHDPELAHRMIDSMGPANEVSMDELVSSDVLQFFDAYLEKSESREDSLLVPTIEKHDWVRQVLSRTTRRNSQLAASGTGTLSAAEKVSPTQLSLGTGAAPDLPVLPESSILYGTVYVPRILWALEWARLDQRGAISAAQIAHILHENADLAVFPNNIARAFRDFKGKEKFSELTGLWTSERKRYQITPAGTKTLRAILNEKKPPAVRKK